MAKNKAKIAFICFFNRRNYTPFLYHRQKISYYWGKYTKF